MVRSSWFLLCMMLLFSSVAATAQKSSLPEYLNDWIKGVPPRMGTESWEAANASEYEWIVEMKNGRPAAHLRNKKAEEASALPPLIKRTRGPHPEPGEIHSYKVVDGWLIAFSPTEGGGSLWWYGEDGRQSYKVSNDHIVQFLPNNRALFALEGQASFNSSRGQIVQIRQNGQGQWMSGQFVDLGSAPDVGMVDSNGDFIVSTTEKLVRIHPDKTETVLVPKVFWTGLSPHSIATSPIGDIYLGMRQGVAIVFPLNKAYQANWLLPNKSFLRAGARN